MWNIERALGIALLASSGVIAFSIASLPFWEEFTLGPGAAPAIYLAGLAICALGLVVRPSPASVGSIGAMISLPGRNGLLLLVLVALLTLSVYAVGFPIGIFLFSLAVLVLIQGWRIPLAALFSALWAASLQIVFGWLLDIRFPDGFLFG
jgi:hypothetical protein